MKRAVLCRVGGFPLYWYGLFFLIGILMTGSYLLRLIAEDPVLSPRQKERFGESLSATVLGTLIGARLGYFLIYAPGYLFRQPLALLWLGQGGMSFHGGVCGGAFTLVGLCMHHRLPLFRICDLLVQALPIGLLFGRIGNFINGELWGRVTTLPWGCYFPDAGPDRRHPSQLYEALLEGLLLGVILRAVRPQLKEGELSALFLALYAGLRFIVEYVREPDAHYGLLWLGCSAGQWLSVPMGLAAALLWGAARRKTP